MNACEANVVEALLKGLQAGALYFDPNDRHLALPWPLAQCRRARLRAALDDLDAALRGAVDQRSLTVRALQRAAANGQPLAMDAFCDHLDALSAACCTASLSRHMRHEGFSTHAVLACSHVHWLRPDALIVRVPKGSSACAAGRARAARAAAPRGDGHDYGSSIIRPYSSGSSMNPGCERSPLDPGWYGVLNRSDHKSPQTGLG